MDSENKSAEPGFPAERDNEAAALLMLFQRQTVPQQQSPSETPPNIQVHESRPEIEQVSSVSINGDPSKQSGLQQAEGQQTSQESEQSSVSPPSQTKSAHTPPSKEAKLARTVTSPGPAAAALASVGYNQKANIKAMVAAAALAAAAAQPMPLISHESPNPLAENVDNNIIAKEDKTESSQIDKQNMEVEELSPDKKEDVTVKDESTSDEVKEKFPEEQAENVEEVPYAVDPDAGIIGCICTFEHDDGFTIQCDRCYRWQHAVCMGIDNIDDAPDNYLCYLCDKSLHIDGEKAKQLQIAYLQPKKRKSSNHHTQKDMDSLDSTSNDTSSFNNKENRSDSNKKSEDKLEDGQNANNGGKANTLTPTSKAKSAKKGKGKKDAEANNSATGANSSTYNDDENSVAIERHQILYFEVDSFEYKNSSIKSLVKKLPELIKRQTEVKEVSQEEFDKSLLASKNYIVKSLPESTKQKFIGLAKLGLFSTKPIAANTNVIELVGELDLKQNYMDEKWNQYWLFGVPKPKVFFHPHLPIVIDERGIGNYSRFIRKSCTPNCEISTFIVDNRVRFVVKTNKEVKGDTELSLPWEWDVNHPIRKIDEGQSSFDSISNEDKSRLIKCVSAILDISECANTGNECPLSKIKKQSSHLQRNTRKFGNKSDEIQEDDYISIDERLFNRDQKIKENIRLNIISNEDNLSPSSREGSAEGSADIDGNYNEEMDVDGKSNHEDEKGNVSIDGSDFVGKDVSRLMTPDGNSLGASGIEASSEVDGNKRHFIDTLIDVDDEYLPMKYKLLKKFKISSMTTKEDETYAVPKSTVKLATPVQIVAEEIKQEVKSSFDLENINSSIQTPPTSSAASNESVPTTSTISLNSSLKPSGSPSSSLPGLSGLVSNPMPSINNQGISLSRGSSSGNTTVAVNDITTNTSQSTIAAETDTGSAANKETKPKVVKKFSLADYKKKIKN